MGLTRIRSEQISNSDYKQSVRLLQKTNVNLTGGAPVVVDGATVSAGDRILVVGQTDSSENGIYSVDTVGIGSNGTWIRSRDADENDEVSAGMQVMVASGATYADTQWKLITDDPITVDTTPLTFMQTISAAFGNVNANGTTITASTLSDSISFTAGNNIAITGNATSKTILFAADLEQITPSQIINGNTDVSIAASDGNVNFSVSGIVDLAVFSTGGLEVAGNVVAENFDSVNADLAEIYHADDEYLPGTVVCFGGQFEVTQSSKYAEPSIAGIVSTKPAYLMNTDAHGLPIALQGRVPCRVVGEINKGQLVTSSNKPGVATGLAPKDWVPGCVIGKALQDYNSDQEGIIEIVAGRI